MLIAIQSAHAQIERILRFSKPVDFFLQSERKRTESRRYDLSRVQLLINTQLAFVMTRSDWRWSLTETMNFGNIEHC